MNTQSYYQLIAVLISLLVPVVLSTNETKYWLKRLSLVFLLVVAAVISILTFIDNANEGNAIAVIIAVSIFDVLYIVISIWGFLTTFKTTSSKKMDKLISNFTAEAASGSIIRIFGGDLNFFGTVYGKNNNIENNTQYKQILEMVNRNVKYHILCLKPTTSDQKRRIGFLAKNCPNVKFAFYQNEHVDSNCTTCDMHNFCTNCHKVPCCDILGNLCPDLRFRGRIVTQNNDSDFVFVANWLVIGHKYEKVKIFKPNTRECNFYVKYWDFIWDRAQKYQNSTLEVVEDCKKLI